MPRWSFSRSQPSPEKARPEANQPSKSARPESKQSLKPASPAPDYRLDLQAELDEARTNESRLREDLAELLTAHRHQGRVLERGQKLLEQNEQELTQLRARAGAPEREVAEQRSLAGQRTAKLHELEQLVPKHQTLQASYEAI